MSHTHLLDKHCSYQALPAMQCGGPADVTISLSLPGQAATVLSCYHHIMDVMFQLARAYGRAERGTKFTVEPTSWFAPWGT